MSEPGAHELDADETLESFERLLDTWRGQDAFASAVVETVARTGYARIDVETQLERVIDRCRAPVMRLVRAEELGTGELPENRPRTVLVLASGGVPGLVLEGIAAAFAVGARALVRPSRDETIIHHLLAGIRVWQPQLAPGIEVVGIGGTQPPWSRADAAVVFGSDETVALVRDRLRPQAASRVAAYGSRQGIAVLAPGADEDTSWSERLADDILTFRQRGCMSPSWVYVVGSPEQAAPLVERLGRDLAHGRARHIARGVDDDVSQRRARDADVLGAIAAGLAPDPSVLYAGDARLTVIRVDDDGELALEVARLGSLLQTAVVACAGDRRATIAELLLDAGCTRICLPGEAHEPFPLWPHDGIGRVAPLVGLAPGHALAPRHS